MITEWCRSVYTVFSQYLGLDLAFTGKVLKGLARMSFIYAVGFVGLKLFAELIIDISNSKLNELDRQQRGTMQEPNFSVMSDKKAPLVSVKFKRPTVPRLKRTLFKLLTMSAILFLFGVAFESV